MRNDRPVRIIAWLVWLDGSNGNKAGGRGRGGCGAAMKESDETDIRGGNFPPMENEIGRIINGEEEGWKE